MVRKGKHEPAKGGKRANPTRTSRNRWRPAHQNVTINEHGLGFPDRYETTLRYAAKFGITGSGSGSAKVFNLNSLYDPDRSGIGGQPQNYDQISQFYGTYWVAGCKWSVELVNANDMVVHCATLVSDDATTVDFSDIIMQPRSRKRTLGTSGSGAARWSVGGYCKTGTLHGQNYIEADPEDYASVGASPNDTAVLVVDAEAADGSTAYHVDCLVTLDYDCIFMGRKRVSPSTLASKQSSLEKEKKPERKERLASMVEGLDAESIELARRMKLIQWINSNILTAVPTDKITFAECTEISKEVINSVCVKGIVSHAALAGIMRLLGLLSDPGLAEKFFEQALPRLEPSPRVKEAQEKN